MRAQGSDDRNGFATPSLDEWRAAADASLRGGSVDDLAWDPGEGFRVPPLLTRADTAELPHLKSGAYRLLQRPRGWRIRELIVAPDPESANAQARDALARGADEIEFGLDALAQDAREPTPLPEDGGEDAWLAWAPPGQGGVAVHRLEDFERCLDAIDLAATTVSFSAGEAALPLLAFWMTLADRRDLGRETVRGDLDLDPIARMTMRQLGVREDEAGVQFVSQRSEVSQVFDETAGVVAFCRDECPGVRPLAFDGQGYHLAGGTATLELAATIAGIAECARRLGERGVSFDAVAAAATVRVQVGHELLLEVAKLRALRLLWAKLAAAFGAERSESFAPRIHAVTSGRGRAQYYDLRTNLLRTTVAGFAAVTGGCDVMTVVPYDEDPETQVPLARALARGQQLLLRSESQLDRVVDPFGGSHAIEVLTDRLGERAWDVLRDIEGRGGLLEAIRGGDLAKLVAEAADARAGEFRHRRRVLVGVSRFADAELGGRRDEPDDDAEGAADAWVETVLAALQVHRARRNRTAVDDALAALAAAAGADIATEAIDAAGAGATVAEIAQATWPPEDTEFCGALALVAGTDGEEFEDLRGHVEDLLAEAPAKVLLAPIGPPRRVLARADLARDLLLVGGFPVEDRGVFADAAAARAAIAELRPDAVVLCAEDARIGASIDELAAALEELSSKASLVVVGTEPEERDPRVAHWLSVDGDAVATLEGLTAALPLMDS